MAFKSDFKSQSSSSFYTTSCPSDNIPLDECTPGAITEITSGYSNGVHSTHVSELKDDTQGAMEVALETEEIQKIVPYTMYCSKSCVLAGQTAITSGLSNGEHAKVAEVQTDSLQ